MNSRKDILLICSFIFLFLAVCLDAQDIPVRVSITGKNVQMRESPAVSAKVITVLNEGNTGTIIETQSLEDNPEYRIFNWVKITVNKFTGWVYGEYVDFSQDEMKINKFRVYNSDEIKVKMNGKILYPGMKESDLMAQIGTAPKKSVKKGLNLVSYEYLNGNLYFEINNASKCVTYIKILDPSIELASGIKIGTSVSDINSANKDGRLNVQNTSISAVSVYAPAYNQWYSPFVIFDVSEKKTIHAIYLGINID